MDTSFEANELLAVIDEGKKSEWPTPTKKIADFPPQRTHPKLHEPPKSTRQNAKPSAIPKLDLLKSKLNRKTAESKTSSHLSPVIEGANESTLSPQQAVDIVVFPESEPVIAADAHDVDAWPETETFVDKPAPAHAAPSSSSSSSSSSQFPTRASPPNKTVNEPPADELRSKEALILLSRVDNVLHALESAQAAPTTDPATAPKSHHLTNFLDEQIDYLLSGVPEVLEDGDIDDDELERLINGTSLYLGQPHYTNSAPHDETQLNLRLQILNLSCNSVHRGLKTNGSFLVLHPPPDCRCFVSLRAVTVELPDLSPPTAQMLGMPGFTRSQKYHSLRHYFVGDVNLDKMELLFELTDNPQKLVMESEGHKLEMRLDLFTVTEEPSVVRGMAPNKRAPLRIGSCYIDIAPALMDPSVNHLQKIKVRVDEVTAPSVSKRMEVLTAGLPQLQRQKQLLGHSLLGSVTVQVRAVKKREPERGDVFDGTLLAQSEVHQALDCVPLERKTVASSDPPPPPPVTESGGNDFVTKSSFTYPTNTEKNILNEPKESLLSSLGKTARGNTEPIPASEERPITQSAPSDGVKRSVSPDPFLDEMVSLLNDKPTKQRDDDEPQPPASQPAVVSTPVPPVDTAVPETLHPRAAPVPVSVTSTTTSSHPSLLLDISVDGLCGLLQSTERFQSFNGCSVYYSLPSRSSASSGGGSSFSTLWWDAVSSVFNSTCRHRIKQQDPLLNLTPQTVGQSIEFLVCLTDLVNADNDGASPLLFGMARLPLVGLSTFLKSPGSGLPDASFALPISILDGESVQRNSFEFTSDKLSLNVRLSCRMEPPLLSSGEGGAGDGTSGVEAGLTAVLKQQRDLLIASQQTKKTASLTLETPQLPSPSLSVSSPLVPKKSNVSGSSLSPEVQRLFDLTYAADPAGFGSFYELNHRNRDTNSNEGTARAVNSSSSGSSFALPGVSSVVSVRIEELMPSLLESHAMSFPEHLLQSHLFCTVSLSKPNRNSCSSPTEAHDSYQCTPLHAATIFDAQQPLLRQTSDWSDVCTLTVNREQLQRWAQQQPPEMLGVVVTLYARRPLFLGLGTDIDSFIGLSGDKVHPVRITDVAVGKAVVDLSTITLLGASEICGWYHLLNDLQRTVGQVKVRIELTDPRQMIQGSDEEELQLSQSMSVPVEESEEPCLQVEYSEELRQLDYEALFRSLHDLDLVRAKLLNQTILSDENDIVSDERELLEEENEDEEEDQAEPSVDDVAEQQVAVAVEELQRDSQPDDSDEKDEDQVGHYSYSNQQSGYSDVNEVSGSSGGSTVSHRIETELEGVLLLPHESEITEAVLEESGNHEPNEKESRLLERGDMSEVEIPTEAEETDELLPGEEVDQPSIADSSVEANDVSSSDQATDLLVDAGTQTSLVSGGGELSSSSSVVIDVSVSELEPSNRSAVDESVVIGELSVSFGREYPLIVPVEPSAASSSDVVGGSNASVVEVVDGTGEGSDSTSLLNESLGMDIGLSVANDGEDAKADTVVTSSAIDEVVPMDGLSDTDEDESCDDSEGDTVREEPTDSIPRPPSIYGSSSFSSAAAPSLSIPPHAALSAGDMPTAGLLSEKPLKLSLAQIRAVSAARSVHCTTNSGSLNNRSSGSVLSASQLKIVEDTQRISKLMTKVINGSVSSL